MKKKTLKLALSIEEPEDGRRIFEKHGYSRTSTYEIWKGMKKRCNCKTSNHYKNYGARGISVCDRWDKFTNFLSDMGERPEGMSIDRIDNNGDYEPLNCRWATNKTQSNNKRNNRSVRYKEEEKSISEWAELLGLSYFAFYERLKTMDLNKAMTMKKYNGESGIEGVSYRKDNKKWKVTIKIKRNYFYLGQYETKFDACCVRISAENKGELCQQHQ